jgi:putative ABC transport system permease protein
VRRALGAPWSSIVRQLITESLVISAIGGAAGWLLVLWAAPLLPRMVPMALPVADVGVNGGVMLFAAAISVLTGAVFGLAPVVPIAQTNIVGSLKEGMRGSTVGAGH